MKQTEINAQTKDSEFTKTWYQASLGTAIVAGVFSLTICVVLVANYFQSKISDPLDSTEFIELKTTLLQLLVLQLLSWQLNLKIWMRF